MPLKGGGGGQIIKSIQRGSFFAGTSGTVKDITISAVDMSKCVVRVYGRYASGTYYSSGATWEAHLTSNTNLRCTRQTAEAYNHTIYWEVIEYGPGVKSVTIYNATAANISNGGTITISPVSDMQKTMLEFTYNTNYGGTGGEWGRMVTLTAANTVTYYCYGQGAVDYTLFVVEFF